MPKIAQIRPVLLSAPYATPDNREVQVHLRSGYRTTGLVEITLDDGTTGLGEGYLAVFAPHVFRAMVELIAPYLVGRESSDLAGLYRDAHRICDYWSVQGAARHAVSAIEIALVDAEAKRRGVPACALFGGAIVSEIPLYGSGGDSTDPAGMRREMALLAQHGIGSFKIRARNHQVAKAAWTLASGARHGIGIAVDMCQNLAEPSQTVADVVDFVSAVRKRTAHPIVFLEEALGPSALGDYPRLRRAAGAPIAGGEIVTTAGELNQRIRAGYYDLAQPDATVLGGVAQTLEVFAACRTAGISAVVHCWGAGVCMMANYHAAFAGGGTLAEWPMPAYALREALMVEPLRIHAGRLQAPRLPGLGVVLSARTEREFPFRPEAVYGCLPVDVPPVSEAVWDGAAD